MENTSSLSLKPVLVLEDDPDIRELLDYALGQAGYDPLLFGSAEQVLDRLSFLTPALVILDLMLPGMGGVDFVRELERRGLRRAPILVISASQYGRARAQQISAEGYLQKPFSFAAMVQLANRLVTDDPARQYSDVQG